MEAAAALPDALAGLHELQQLTLNLMGWQTGPGAKEPGLPNLSKPESHSSLGWQSYHSASRELAKQQLQRLPPEELQTARFLILL